MTHLSALLLWLPLEYLSIRYLWMISRIMWSRSHWGGEQNCYLWEFRQKWTDRNLMKFQPSKGKVLGPGQNNCNTGQTRDRVTERFAEKSWRFMVGKSWPWVSTVPCRKEGWSHLRLWQQECSKQTGRTDPWQLFTLVRPYLECCVLPRTTLAYSRKSREGHQGGQHLRAQARKVWVS